jgi:hypothetical protein
MKFGLHITTIGDTVSHNKSGQNWGSLQVSTSGTAAGLLAPRNCSKVFWGRACVVSGNRRAYSDIRPQQELKLSGQCRHIGRSVRAAERGNEYIKLTD